MSNRKTSKYGSQLKKPNLRKQQRTFKGFKFWPTQKLKEVIDDPYNRGADGADYGVCIDEIKDAYYERLNKEDEKRQKELDKEQLEYTKYLAEIDL